MRKRAGFIVLLLLFIGCIFSVRSFAWFIAHANY